MIHRRAALAAMAVYAGGQSSLGVPAGIEWSTDGGDTWTPFGSGYEAADTSDLRADPSGMTLVAGTPANGVFTAQIAS
jgi:hypothetical protein